MGELQIYLGGKMYGLSMDEMNSWRENFIDIISPCAENYDVRLRCINPCIYYNFEEKRQKNELEVMKFDIARVKESDLLVVNLDGLNSSTGTAIECYEAFKSDIPVLVFGDEFTYNNLHPWIQNCITRRDESILETVEYIKDFYLRQAVRLRMG